MSSLLLNHLTQEHAAVGAFLELLDQEAAAMSQGNFAALPALAERKSHLIEQVALLDKQREIEQIGLGYAADRSGADAAAAAGGEVLQAAWRDLRERATQAREHNHRNGVMVHTHLDFTRQSINFLKASGQPLYGPDGTHHTGGGRGKRLATG
ncbi:MAG: flagellar biosynthesis protein [Polaromonas sp. 39-63-203]|jgi:flagella synthesis protein FlgN|uniref:flagella synthesis protein FlgN n=1 Tax=Polaromonas sp. TaxID=1869339 RepID=UPI000BDA26F1|nr:flagellar protein FlgN [Polaromonas sp.]OYY53582.1 MAG: flagellar biosynthesis protein [Polaromonas sp. 35-63-240]OYZ03243.1 MAG: flagellar biosynthesis protein [Polaromonas sp. 28-63-22]OYZ85013.1 MAG: flagellar biosynthesis protein [Polaromonas sp. 24-62-144]OZB02360.1 MAG: flagellar biosynthesis protein [Polaromonas sp. 39-63-203]HQS32638.1 flagellar protein FlgN [Polaromonas sp.]